MTRQKARSTKTKVLTFRVSNEVYDKVIQASESAGITTREWFELAVIDNRTRIVERPKLSGDLGRLRLSVNSIGNNINQIAYNLNTARLAGSLSHEQCVKAIAELSYYQKRLIEIAVLYVG
jgi:hypothetical protein